MPEQFGPRIPIYVHLLEHPCSYAPSGAFASSSHRTTDLQINPTPRVGKEILYRKYVTPTIPAMILNLPHRVDVFPLLVIFVAQLEYLHRFRRRYLERNRISSRRGVILKSKRRIPRSDAVHTLASVSPLPSSGVSLLIMRLMPFVSR
jgi:hypothetical protein